MKLRKILTNLKISKYTPTIWVLIMSIIYTILGIFLDKELIIQSHAYWALYGALFMGVILIVLEIIESPSPKQEDQYLYESFDEYNKIMGGDLHEGHKIIWDMARTKRHHVGLKEKS